MARIPHNIESTRWHGNAYRIGYAKSNGAAVRIYGGAKHGYKVDGKYCRTLADVSAHLETM